MSGVAMSFKAVLGIRSWRRGGRTFFGTLIQLFTSLSQQSRLRRTYTLHRFITSSLEDCHHAHLLGRPVGKGGKGLATEPGRIERA